MNKAKKKEWIEAFEVTRQEYRDKEHDTSNCSLCELADDMCIDCPINVFKNNQNRYGCLCRIVEPMCIKDDPHFNESLNWAAVTEFWEEAIDIFKNSPMHEKKYNKDTHSIWSQDIKALDIKVAKKYDLI